MNNYNKIKKIILALLLPAIISLFFNATVNKHYHLLSSGQVIQHAHPFSNNTDSQTPFQNHNHSKTELIILNILTNTISLAIIFLIFALELFIFKQKKLFTFINNQYNQIYLFVKKSRAPPIILS